jgi:hypothetical protein
LRTSPRTTLRKDDECDQDVGEEEEEEEDAVVLIFVVVVKQPISLSLSLSLFGACLARSQLAVPFFATRSFLFFFVESLAKRKEEKNF